MKTYRLFILFIFIALVGPNSEAAVSIQVVFKDQQYRVIDVKRNQPVIQVEGKRRAISRSRIGMNKQDPFAFKDGYFELKDRRIRTRSQSSSSGGGQFNSRLFFNAQIRTSVEVENGFIVIELIPTAGESRIVLAELKDFPANKWTRVEFSVPIIKSLGGGKAKHYIFSNGVQVLPKGQFEQVAKHRVENTVMDTAMRDRPPQIIAPFNPGFPKSLIGIISEGSVRLEYTLGKDGYARNVTVIESTHELLDQPAIDSILKSTFQSGIKDGRPMAARLRQTISFYAPNGNSGSAPMAKID